MVRNFLLFFLIISLLQSCQEPDSNAQFTLLSSGKTGITFKNTLKETETFNVLKYGYFYNGGGVAIGDINNDGLPDIYFTGNMVASHLYLNKGDWKFEEIAQPSGVAAAGMWNTGVTMADVNGDGWLDIYVCRSAAINPFNRKNLLFINNKDLTFTEHADNFGLADPGYSTQASFFDYDRDGDLDMFLLNHSVQEYAGFSNITSNLKSRFNPNHGDKLYRNDEVLFTDVSRGSGIKSNVLGFGLGVAVSDLNHDGWPDIYVSNDYNEQDYLYINNQDGTFSERLSDFMDHVSLFSMGSDIADINNDGYFDVMTLDMLPEDNYRQKLVLGPDNYDKYQLLVKSGFYNQTMRNMLQLNLGGKGFSEIGQLAGVSNTDWSWASLFADFDLDGNKDLFITNGYKRDFTNMDFLNYMVNEKIKQQGGAAEPATMEVIEQMPSISVPNYMYQNTGDLRFADQTKDWGFNQPSSSNGAAYGDLDNDGDLDLVVNNVNQQAFIYKNNSAQISGNHYLKISLAGNIGNTKGIGSKVEVHLDDKVLYQELMPTRGFQSSVDYDLSFGLGADANVLLVKVIWPDGKVQIIENVSGDQKIILDQNDADSASNEPVDYRPLFKAPVDNLGLNFVHRENDYNDFKREQLLPHQLSRQGPGTAMGDINGDGLSDLYIGGAKGSAGKVFFQTSEGKFQETSTILGDSLAEDTSALLFDADGDEDIDLYVVSGGNDFSANDPALQDRLYFNNGSGVMEKRQSALPEMHTSGSCVTVADIDNDGDLDLFIGGRVIPGNYPVSPRSYLLENDGQGNFTDVTVRYNSSLEYPGLVTDAMWTDFNGDNEVDLIIVGEWMPIRAFENTGSQLIEITDPSSGIAGSEGWWNRIMADDFDGDGDPDYVIGNFGLNAQFKASDQEPVQLFVKDFDGNGTIDPVLTYFLQGRSYPALSKDDLEAQLPGIKKKYVSYSSFGDQGITDIFSSAELKDTIVFKARNLASGYLENLGNNQFKLSDLPLSAQVAPVFGIASGDFDGDGNKDLILGGNFSGSRVKFGNYDASRSNFLRGDGQGNFSSIEGYKSGIMIRGEVKDISVWPTADQPEYVLFVRNNDSVLVYQIVR